ncbi:MAG: hypothetical protein KAG66_19995, partial [Methylococcales bacterium]|nr:hypothetical protein [Methylococcales bacterium]
MYRIEALRNRHFFFIDLFALLLIPLVALILRLDILAIPPGFWLGLISYTILALVVRLLVFRKVGLYARFWRYASLAEAAEIIVAVLISTAIISIITLIARAIFTIDFARSV